MVGFLCVVGILNFCSLKQLSNMQYTIVSCSYHVIHYICRIYLFTGSLYHLTISPISPRRQLHIYIHIYIYTHTCTHAYIYTYIYIYIYIWIYIHTYRKDCNERFRMWVKHDKNEGTESWVVWSLIKSNTYIGGLQHFLKIQKEGDV